jgi:NADPH:quinone reductase
MTTPRTTRALTVPRHGGSEVLQVTNRTIGDPAPGQLLVAVAAVGVNFVEIYQREGIYPTQPPFALGSEGAGTVLALGAGVTGFGVGDRISWARAEGSAADLVLVEAQNAVAVPAGLDLETAAAAMLQGMTAHFLVNSTYPVQSGDWALVHAAAGGVGQLLIQLIKARGGHVVATASTAAKVAIAERLGADVVLNYGSGSDAKPDDLAAAIRSAVADHGATAGHGAPEGVDVVFDGVGLSTFDASLASLRPRGMLVLFGGASGQVPPFDIQRLNRAGSLFLTRPTLNSYLATPEEFRWRSGDILSALAARSLTIEIGGRYPLEQAAQAYDDLASRRTTGKLLLIP